MFRAKRRGSRRDTRVTILLKPPNILILHGKYPCMLLWTYKIVVQSIQFLASILDFRFHDFWQNWENFPKQQTISPSPRAYSYHPGFPQKKRIVNILISQDMVCSFSLDIPYLVLYRLTHWNSILSYKDWHFETFAYTFICGLPESLPNIFINNLIVIPVCY